MLKNKKILFVLPRMGGGGAERVTALIANVLCEQGNEVTIYTLVGGDSFYPLNSAIHYESVGISVNRKNRMATFVSEGTALPKSYFKIRNMIKHGQFDVVFSLLVETDILVGACKWTGLQFRHVCSERNDPTRRSEKLLKILNSIYKKASLFVCQSRMVSDFYKDVPERIKVVISNPINPEGLPERPDSLTKRVVAIGKLMDQKNFPLLIKSFAKVSGKYPEYVLDIYGEGERRPQLEALISQMEMNQKIHLKGASKQVQEDIADAELFVMSSDFEGFPNVLLEAIAIGLPVISTDFATGIARELVGEDNGIVVPVGNVDKMAAAIDALLDNEELRHRMGQRNKEKAKKYYTKEIIQQWNDALERIV